MGAPPIYIPKRREEEKHHAQLIPPRPTKGLTRKGNAPRYAERVHAIAAPRIMTNEPVGPGWRTVQGVGIEFFVHGTNQDAGKRLAGAHRKICMTWFLLVVLLQSGAWQVLKG